MYGGSPKLSTVFRKKSSMLKSKVRIRLFDLGSYYLYIEIKNYKFSIKNFTKWQHWRHFRNVCFLGEALQHAENRVQNLIWNKMKIFFLIYMRIGRETL